MSKKPYRGHKSEWNRDEGSVPGHPIKHPGLVQMGQVHTSFQSRGFHEDKGSNTRPDNIHTGKTNKLKHNPDARGPNGSHGGHNPLPGSYHSNSGLSAAGHQLVRRGGSVISGMSRGLK